MTWKKLNWQKSKDIEEDNEFDDDKELYQPAQKVVADSIPPQDEVVSAMTNSSSEHTIFFYLIFHLWQLT